MPSLADIMKWRHLKLAYNWPLAAFEVGQMQQSFSAAAQRYSVFNNLPLAQLVKDESEPPLPKSPAPRTADERMQPLPSDCKAGLYRDKHSNTLAFQQSAVCPQRVAWISFARIALSFVTFALDDSRRQ